MADPGFYQLPRTRYTAVELEVLKAIENAWKQRAINFATAIKLRDLLRAGKVDMVLKTLTQLTGKPVKLTNPLTYNDESN